MKVYLSARFTRRMEMRGYARELEAMGHEVVSNWIWSDIADDRDLSHEEQRQLASGDFHDVIQANLFIAFTEDQALRLPGFARGGRHAEFGMAVAFGCGIVVIGLREHVFHHMAPQFETWAEYVAALSGLLGQPEALTNA